MTAKLRHVAATDGTRIALHEHGHADRAGLGSIIVLTNGLSTTSNFWVPLVRALGAEHRVVHWDYRGHGRSELARSGDYAVATHADDLARVTEAVRESPPAKPPVHVAFSMGVTVLLELYRRSPELVGAMVLLAGGADHPYATSPLFRVPGARAAVRGGLRAAAPIATRLGPVARRVAASKVLFPISRAVGAIGAEAPREEVEHFFRAVGAMDMRAYWGSLTSLMEAHASDVLPRVRVPVLVVAPEHDVMAPRGDLETLRRAIPGAEWTLVPGTGHAILLEAGDVVGERVRRFVDGLD